MKKKLFLFTSIFASLAIMSSGFAAWVISQGDTKTSEGGIIVETVNDNRHTMTVTKVKMDTTNNLVAVGEGDTNSHQIRYAAPSNATSGWLTSNGREETENLTVYFKVAILNVNAETVVANVFDSTNTNVTASPAYTTAQNKTFKGQEKQILGNLPSVEFVNVEGNTTTNCIDFGSGSYGVYVKLAFKWGSAFEGKNPYNYYNDGTKTSLTHGDEAFALLNHLKTNMIAVTYTLKLTTI